MTNYLKAIATAIGVAASGSLFAATSNLSSEVAIGKLELPWDIAFLQDGTMLFTGKRKGLSDRLPSGTINKLHGLGGVNSYASSSADLFCDDQLGMMSIAVDSEFSKSQYIYSCSSSNINDKLLNRLIRFKGDQDLTSVSVRTDIVSDVRYKPKVSKHPFDGPGSYNGGRIRFSPGVGFRYMTTGDNHKKFTPQDPTYIGGKVPRIDRDGKAGTVNLSLARRPDPISQVGLRKSLQRFACCCDPSDRRRVAVTEAAGLRIGRNAARQRARW